jgi:hypothetical protein
MKILRYFISAIKETVVLDVFFLIFPIWDEKYRFHNFYFRGTLSDRLR